MKKVVLLLPPYSGPPLGPPAGLLALASPLRESGYTVKIIDGSVMPEYLEAVRKEVPGALCFGVSLLTGPMIQGAVEAARLVKQLQPRLPVIFGGWHPSLTTEQTLRESSVDVVVRHQGEVTFAEVVSRIEQGQALGGVRGCWFKQPHGIQRNRDRPTTPLESLPTPAYDLVDFDLYQRFSGQRLLPYASSLGCPYACHYCTDTVFYNRRFNAYSAQRVVAEVTQLVRQHRLNKVALLDSNFLVDTRRACRIAAGFVDSGLGFSWSFQASTDLLCRMTDSEVGLLAKSGVHHIGFGTESASEELLGKMNKRHQRIPDMFETARKCGQAGIRVTFNLIFGYPGETEADRRQTLGVMGEIAGRFNHVTFSPNVFTAYPGIPIWPELENLGLEQPRSLEAWTQIALGSNRLPWLQGHSYDRLKRSLSFFLLSNELAKAERRSRAGGVQHLLWRLTRQPLRMRLKYQFFDWPLELWLANARNKLVMRRSLLNGQGLGTSLENVS